MLPVIISASVLTFTCVNPYSDFDAINTPPCASPSLSLIINFQSIKNKRTELPVLLETVQPDVIIGTETWLTKNTGNGEIFPAELGFDVI
jgi:hypothetical protein